MVLLSLEMKEYSELLLMSCDPVNNYKKNKIVWKVFN
jgi:hypothetical protein